MGRIAGVTPAETRERLVDAAATVFELKGYEGATVAQIAREAGVTTGAIYAHYGSKAELLVDALRTHADRATASLLPPERRPDAATVLRTLATALADRDRVSSALLPEALLAARRDAELAQVLAGALVDRESAMADMISGGQDAGVLAGEISADAAARFALMLGLGSMLVRELDLPEVDRQEWADFIRRFIDTFTEGDGSHDRDRS